MKVGDYVRTYDGIGRIVETRVFLNTNEFRLDGGVGNITQIPDNTKWNDNRNVIKSSPNIIDLIEVGDYVNGHLVKNRRASCNENLGGHPKQIDIGENEEYKWLAEQNINSIVTKEQFSQMEYRIGE